MNTQRILVVDDEPGVTRSLKINLESAGSFDVTIENRSVDAVKTARRIKPDLILLDVMMPGMDGGDIAARMEADPMLRDIPIIFLTAVLSNEETEGHEVTKGDHTFIAKPVDIGELRKSIQDHIRR